MVYEEASGDLIHPETMQRVVCVFCEGATKGVQASVWMCLGYEGEDPEPWTNSQRGM